MARVALAPYIAQQGHLFGKAEYAEVNEASFGAIDVAPLLAVFDLLVPIGGSVPAALFSGA